MLTANVAITVIYFHFLHLNSLAVIKTVSEARENPQWNVFLLTITTLVVLYVINGLWWAAKY